MASEKPISHNEFAKMVGVTRQAIGKALREGRISQAAVAGKGKLFASIAMQEYRNNTDPSRQGRLSAHARELQGRTARAPLAPPPPSAEAVGSDFNTAKKVDMVYRAKIRELEYKEKLGKLVDKEAVYRELFNAGKELRVALMAIPDRIIDDVLACATRAEAHSMLYRAIAEALEMVSEIESRKI